MPNIKLQSSDGVIFDEDVEVAQCSLTIKTMLEDLGMQEGEEEVIPLPNVDSATFKKVIVWAKHHKDDPPSAEGDEKQEQEKRIFDDIDSWDADFLKINQETLFKLMLAATYVDIKGLLDVTTKTVANMLKGRTPEEIREVFNIKNDTTTTPVQEKRVRMEDE